MDTKVGITTPTKNRPDFIIRQIQYYAKVKSPHTLYIGDSSSPENANKIQSTINKFKNTIHIVYCHYPHLNDIECQCQLTTLIQEKYACFIGDDDIQIPDSLTRCAEFLEQNPDYATAHGHAVAIRVKDSKAFGEITKIKDYPQPYVDQNLASERFLDYMKNYYATHFSVCRTKDFQKNYALTNTIYDKSFSGEILTSSLSIIDGKSKCLDCLSFIRQIHDRRQLIPNTFDWLTREGWNTAYNAFEKITAQAISEKDNIPLDTARSVIRQAFWFFLKKQLQIEYYETYPEPNKKISFKSKIAMTLPFLKPIYKKIRPMISKKRWLHAEVLNPRSPYNKDFKIIQEIISEKFNNE